MKRLKTKKLTAPRASSANWPQPLTYLVSALVQHSLMSSLSIVGSGATVLAAPPTFRSRKQPILSRRSRFAKSIDLPLVAHLTIHWAYTNIGDDPDGKSFDVRGWSVQARSVGPLFDGRAPRRDAAEPPSPAPTSMTFSASRALISCSDDISRCSYRSLHDDFFEASPRGSSHGPFNDERGCIQCRNDLHVSKTHHW